MFDFNIGQEDITAGDTTSCTKEQLGVTDEQFRVLGLELGSCPKYEDKSYIISGQWSSILSKYTAF